MQKEDTAAAAARTGCDSAAATSPPAAATSSTRADGSRPVPAVIAGRFAGEPHGHLLRIRQVRLDAGESRRSGQERRLVEATHNTAVVQIEGHCDERGTNEYNLALGERRAKAAMDYLVSLGVPGNRLTIITYGKERPQCTDSNESCWQRNRRAHFLITSK